MPASGFPQADSGCQALCSQTETEATPNFNPHCTIRCMASQLAIFIVVRREVMTVWPDPRAEHLSQVLRELTTRLLVETDSKKLTALVEQMTRIVGGQLRQSMQN
jgi:hypothetical protein